MLVSLGNWLAAVGGVELTSLVSASAKATILGAVAALVCAALGSRSARARQLVWNVTLAGVLVIPVLTLVTPTWHVLTLATPAGENEALMTDVATDPGVTTGSDVTSGSDGPAAAATAGGGDTPRERTVPSRRAAAMSWLSRVEGSVWVLVVWLAGVFMVAAALVRGLVGARSLARRAAVVDDASWLRMVSAMRRRIGLKRPVRLLTGDVAAPMTWGILRPVVLLPADADAWSPERRSVVLLHELIHIKRYDWLAQMAGRIACCLYWFNPVLWFAAHRLAVEREQACDEAVLSCSITRPSAYARLLLEMAQRVARTTVPAAMLTMARPGQLEGRLMSILNNRGYPTRRGMLLVPALMAVVMMSLALVEPWRDAPQAAPPDPPPAPVDVDVATGVGVARSGDSGKSGSGFHGTMHSTNEGIRYMYGTRNGVFVFESYIDDANLHVQVVGDVDFSKDGTSVERMDRNASIVLETIDGRPRIELEIYAGRDGELQYDLEVDRRDRELDDDARKWMATALEVCHAHMQIAQIEGERNRLRGEINSIYGDRNRLQGEINRVHGDRNRLQGEINRVHGDRNRLQGQINGIYGERNALQGQINSIYGERNALQGRINGARAKRHHLESELDRIDDERRELRRERRRTDDRKAQARLDDRIADLEQKEKDIEQQLDDIEDVEVEQYRRQLEDLNIDERVRDEMAAIEALDIERRVAALQEQIDGLGVDEEVAGIEAQIDALDIDGRVAEIEKQIDALDVERRVDELEKKIDALNTDERVEKIEKRLDDKYRKLDQLTKALAG